MQLGGEQELRDKIKKEFTGKLVLRFLDIVILAHFQNAPFGVTEVMKFIQKQFGIGLNAGPVYSTIHSMERKQLLTGIMSNKERIYKVTSFGKLTAEVVTSPDEIGFFMGRIMGKLNGSDAFAKEKPN